MYLYNCKIYQHINIFSHSWVKRIETKNEREKEREREWDKHCVDVTMYN